MLLFISHLSCGLSPMIIQNFLGFILYMKLLITALDVLSCQWLMVKHNVINEYGEISSI